MYIHLQFVSVHGSWTGSRNMTCQSIFSLHSLIFDPAHPPKIQALNSTSVGLGAWLVARDILRVQMCDWRGPMAGGAGRSRSKGRGRFWLRIPSGGWDRSDVCDEPHLHPPAKGE